MSMKLVISIVSEFQGVVIATLTRRSVLSSKWRSFSTATKIVVSLSCNVAHSGKLSDQLLTILMKIYYIYIHIFFNKFCAFILCEITKGESVLPGPPHKKSYASPLHSRLFLTVSTSPETPKIVGTLFNPTLAHYTENDHVKLSPSQTL